MREVRSIILLFDHCFYPKLPYSFSFCFWAVWTYLNSVVTCENGIETLLINGVYFTNCRKVKEKERKRNLLEQLLMEDYFSNSTFKFLNRLAKIQLEWIRLLKNNQNLFFCMFKIVFLYSKVVQCFPKCYYQECENFIFKRLKENNIADLFFRGYMPLGILFILSG